jgi:hypothetical protein
VPPVAPARARLVLLVRASDQVDGRFSFHYTLTHRALTQGAPGRAADLEPWPAWPLTVVGRGEGYATVQGAAISPALALKPGDSLTVRCGRDWGFVWGAWLVPDAGEGGA